MKILRFLLSLSALWLASLAWAATPAVRPPSPAGSASADADWAVVEQSFSPAAANAGVPRPSADKRAEVLAWGLRYVNGILTAAGDFHEKHPDDPRRWMGVLQMVDKFESWTGNEPSWSEAERRAADAVIPAAARDEWRKKIEELRVAALAASDIAPRERIYFDSQKFFRARGAVAAARRAKQPVDLAPLKAEFDRLLAAYPDQPVMANHAASYVLLKLGNGATPDQLKQEWQALATSPNEHIRKRAEERLRFLGLSGQPLDIAFMAVDGRAVDLKALRGKVVLVDFWATWCGPCIAELPNIKKVYANYHEKGFEIIGIALENGKLQPDDTPEQTAAKLEKARKVLTDFTAKENMPWPQYFDGKFWKTDISTKFDIESIPAMFLLDQEGKVVTTDARGEKLEQEVRRLLKL